MLSVGTDVFSKANEVMGIRMNTDQDDLSLTAFSQDILKIEISGPNVCLPSTKICISKLTLLR